MGKDNIVLISLYNVNSLPICTLRAILQEAGFNVNSIFFKRINFLNNTMDPPSNNEISSLIKLIKRLQPKFIGISVCSTLFELASKITKEIKKESNTLVIWGGIHPTVRPEQCLEFADIVCVGEGEGAIRELAAKLAKGEETVNIQNLWIKNGDKIIRNDLRPLIQNLDSIPFPDFSNENKYLVESGDVLAYQQQEEYDSMTSRGCPFSCTFCCNNATRRIYRGKGKYLRRRNVDSVIEELVQAKERFNGLRYIRFWDDVFTLDSNWITEFCGKYKKAVNLPFFCYCHPSSTSEKMIQLLKDAGVVHIAMGIQSGSERIRHKYYERYDKNEEIVKSAHLLHKYKINHFFELIMDNPLETEIDKRESLNLLLKLPKPYALSTPTLTHFPETKLTMLLLEKGMISEKDVEDRKQKGYERWTPILDLRRDKENMFWDALYFLAKNRHIPKQIIIGLSHSSFLKKHPKLLTLLLRWISTNQYTVRRGSKVDMARVYLISFLKRRLIYVLRYLKKIKKFLFDIQFRRLFEKKGCNR